MDEGLAPLDPSRKTVLFYIFERLSHVFLHGPAMVLCATYYYKQFKCYIL